ncbi:MAG: hypothetical protein R3249_02485, partial [Nitriliruptorales bacterium]|nr:hypothetical protein [Nitriliruptorales bacterium]
TAEWGDYVSGPRVINESSRQAMKDILAEIQDGTFAKNWIDEWDSGAENFMAKRHAARTSQLEEVGKKLRSMMAWIDTPEFD